MQIDMGPSALPREIALATATSLEGLWKFLFMEGVVKESQLLFMIDRMVKHLEAINEPRAAAALKAGFSGALDGEWERVRALAHSSNDKPM